MVDIIIRNAPDEELAILHIRAARRAMQSDEPETVVSFENDRLFHVRKTGKSLIVREV